MSTPTMVHLFIGNDGQSDPDEMFTLTVRDEDWPVWLDFPGLLVRNVDEMVTHLSDTYWGWSHEEHSAPGLDVGTELMAEIADKVCRAIHDQGCNHDIQIENTELQKFDGQEPQLLLQVADNETTMQLKIDDTGYIHEAAEWDNKAGDDGHGAWVPAMGTCYLLGLITSMVSYALELD